MSEASHSEDSSGDAFLAQIYLKIKLGAKKFMGEKLGAKNLGAHCTGTPIL